jgi:hypothetical protein
MAQDQRQGALADRTEANDDDRAGKVDLIRNDSHRVLEKGGQRTVLRPTRMLPTLPQRTMTARGWPLCSREPNGGRALKRVPGERVLQRTPDG